MNKYNSKNFIPFNKPFQSGEEAEQVTKVIESNIITGNGINSIMCMNFFEKRFGFKRTFLTHSCSSALEMAALLCDLSPDDEVILPSYGYPTMASAFYKTGVKIRFADSEEKSPNIAFNSIKELINSKTKAIVVVHYGGMACDIISIKKFTEQRNILLIEDCAQAINAYHKNRALGSFGDISTFSFHETKNIQCGEGGLLALNNESLVSKADNIWKEGTNKTAFEQGEVDNYQWVELGSSFQPSELSAAFLLSQLNKIDEVTENRKINWLHYHSSIKKLTGHNKLVISNDVEEGHNAHIFYIKCPNKQFRDNLASYLLENGISSVSHYQPLHKSLFWLNHNRYACLPNAEEWSDCILRLPIFYKIKREDQNFIIERIGAFLLENEPLKTFNLNLKV